MKDFAELIGGFSSREVPFVGVSSSRLDRCTEVSFPEIRVALVSVVVRDQSSGPLGEYHQSSEGPSWRSTGRISFLFRCVPCHGMQVYEAFCATYVYFRRREGCCWLESD
jgi:hypothetical protein